jgi:hypothetical protein
MGDFPWDFIFLSKFELEKMKKKFQKNLLVWIFAKEEKNSNLSIPRIMSFAVKSYCPGMCGPKVMTSTNGLIFLIPQCDVDILLPLMPSIMYVGGIFTINIHDPERQSHSGWVCLWYLLTEWKSANFRLKVRLLYFIILDSWVNKQVPFQAKKMCFTASMWQSTLSILLTTH